MCGIAGFSVEASVPVEKRARLLLEGIKHRGPDGNHFAETIDGAYCFVHARLSIIDLSDKGQQPMSIQSGDWMISYNGEIYNYRELRCLISTKFPEYKWLSSSDTEVLLALIALLGVKEAVSMLQGMYAFAAYNVTTKRLYLVRDLFGEKPLYYSIRQGQIVFASDIRAIKNIEGFCSTIRSKSVKNFLKYGFLPGEEAIYEDVFQVKPGHIVEVLNSRLIKTTKINEYELFNDFKFHVKQDKEIIDQCEKLIASSVLKASVSDVPIGFFLSGGVDSSLVSTLASMQSSQPIDTYTISFDDHRFDEASLAQLVADKIGSNHTTHVMKPGDIEYCFEEAGRVWSEPFADPSQIPMIMLSKIVSTEKKVAISGDGGDEVFCGYTRYCSGLEFFRKIARTPRGIRQIIVSLLDRLYVDKFVFSFGNYEKFLKAKLVLSCESNFDYFDSVLTKGRLITNTFKPGVSPNHISEYRLHQGALDFRREMMEIDARVYLPASVLTKVDRASMHYGLEARAPLLNGELVSYVSSLKIETLYRNNNPKYILKQILSKYLDVSIYNRPKHGFNAPIAEWLRGPLSGWAEHMLFSENKYIKENFAIPVIQRMWGEFKQGDQSKFNEIWLIINFYNWLKNQW